MPISKIEKRQFHKKQRIPKQQLNAIVRNGSMEDLEDFEDLENLQDFEDFEDMGIPGVGGG